VRSATRLSRGAARFRAWVCAALRRDSGRRFASRHAVIGWRGVIPGASARPAVRLLRGAIAGVGSCRAAQSSLATARFRARVRIALRGSRAAQRDSGRRFAPRRARGAARFRVRVRAVPRGYRAVRFLHLFQYVCVFILYSSIFEYIPAHSSAFRIFAIFAEHVGICRKLLNMGECWNMLKYAGTYRNMMDTLEMPKIWGNNMKHVGTFRY